MLSCCVVDFVVVGFSLCELFLHNLYSLTEFMPRKRKARDESSDEEIGAIGTGRSQGRLADGGEAASCLDTKTSGLRGLRGRPIPLNASSVELKEIYFEKQRKSSQHCLRHAVNNVFGGEVLTFAQLDEQRRKIDEVYWKPHFDKALEAFSAEVKNKKKVNDFKKKLCNGDSNGNWTMNVLADYLLTHTSLKLVRISRGGGKKSGHLHMSTIKAALSTHGCIIVMCEWFQYKMNQAHWIAIRGNVVLDSMQSTPFLLEEYNTPERPLLASYATRMYTINENIKNKKNRASEASIL